MLQCRNMNLCLLSVVASLQNVPQTQSYSFKNVLFCKLHMSVADNENQTFLASETFLY